MIRLAVMKENAFYWFVLWVDRIHGDSVNKRVARGEMAKQNPIG